MICDIIAMYFTSKKDYYRQKKYLYVDEFGNESEVSVVHTTDSVDLVHENENVLNSRVRTYDC